MQTSSEKPPIQTLKKALKGKSLIICQIIKNMIIFDSHGNPINLIGYAHR